MELADNILSASFTAGLAVVGYLLQHFIQSLRKEIKELREENKAQGEVLFQLELDLNEAWFRIRQANGVCGGRRKTRLTKAWRKDEHSSRHWTSRACEDFDESGSEEEGV